MAWELDRNSRRYAARPHEFFKSANLSQHEAYWFDFTVARCAERYRAIRLQEVLAATKDPTVAMSLLMYEEQ